MQASTRTQSYRKLIEGKCSEKDCKDVVKQFYERYMHKEWKSYFDRLEEADPNFTMPQVPYS